MSSPSDTLLFWSTHFSHSPTESEIGYDKLYQAFSFHGHSSCTELGKMDDWVYQHTF